MRDSTTVAGIAVGMPTNIAVNQDRTGKITNIEVRNRQLYVKKCLRPEQIGGIMLCDASRGDTVYALILAVSDDCGKYHKLTKEQKLRGEQASVNMEGVKPNMKCVTPDDHPWGIIRSTFGQDEFFIREDIIKWVE